MKRGIHSRDAWPTSMYGTMAAAAPKETTSPAHEGAGPRETSREGSAARNAAPATPREAPASSPRDTGNPHASAPREMMSGVEQTRRRDRGRDVFWRPMTHRAKCAPRKTPLVMSWRALARQRERRSGEAAGRSRRARHAASTAEVAWSRQLANNVGGTSGRRRNATPAVETAKTDAAICAHAQRGAPRNVRAGGTGEARAAVVVDHAAASSSEDPAWTPPASSASPPEPKCGDRSGDIARHPRRDQGRTEDARVRRARKRPTPERARRRLRGSTRRRQTRFRGVFRARRSYRRRVVGAHANYLS